MELLVFRMEDRKEWSRMEAEHHAESSLVLRSTFFRNPYTEKVDNLKTERIWKIAIGEDQSA
ncbi:MAG: hypothetical protein B9J98_07165 [Candidatus Terraquivivens tikiterensis]|uniref:Uncharacterized protein n=1 Tax=Candidatus Terraquivivens tikiterensis TaxID=1980982 RepID=A0A2R7Y1J9_9ARCH|nr:MAG: hypothetical protein B9J98_07165 [Candidatus Terraquivivens tikiterensis]